TPGPFDAPAGRPGRTGRVRVRAGTPAGPDLGSLGDSGSHSGRERISPGADPRRRRVRADLDSPVGADPGHGRALPVARSAGQGGAAADDLLPDSVPDPGAVAGLLQPAERITGD